uniref:Tektin n=1 Tax=Macrostomum lignano TaxID=282301 RepID=A0A1I8IUC6_9PLAT
MRRMVEKSTAQLSVNWAALQQLNKDLRNKTQAQSIDGKIIHLGNQSPGIDFRPGAESAERCVSIPHSWARHSQENIGKSHACRAASERQCKGIADLLRACAKRDVEPIYCCQRRVCPSNQGGHRRAQRAAGSAAREIADAERSAAQLRRAIEDKAAPMKVAQTRLEERARRQDMESCNDTPMIALQREVADLHESLSSLAHRLKSVESALVRLHSNRDKLESDIRVKENSLLIDVKRCMAMRKAPRGAQQLLMQPRRAMP